ncbi:DUF21 domain-containing protein [Methanosalsum natronophilum]|uniref:DUF21 domain-containing protein n=1 Tax=Methanosalsum natronophilum TaxID=768733 RepID=A0A3R7XID7_9EURY|nr:CNNM domain-containing protein [Methanosalsum natronophilum]MCS3923564.1 CBS domain containing-hemolysin-like protein [Methanosalsum natronophilum]RQD86132.1 MAG: DUF21 domain-containing protein [Methanosalsum natronophilum]
MDVTWIFIVLCLIQSGLFAGLTIGLFGLSRLKLEIESDAGNKNAKKILKVRKDSNFLLTTLLWGNVAVNVLIALLTESVMTGVGAFVFSTVGITIFGEIVPQAYFSRHTLRVGAHLVPMIRFYQVLLYPVAKPSAILLDKWLGKEELQLFKERSLMLMLEKHIESSKTDIGKLEGIGAINFLAMDDIRIENEGSIIDPRSVITLPFRGNYPIFPDFKRSADDPFLQMVQSSGKKWVILADEDEQPRMVIDADDFLRDVIYKEEPFYALHYCHNPVIVTSPDTRLEQVIKRLKVYPLHEKDHVIDLDLIIYWGEEDYQRRIITGSDILGRLLKGIVLRVH